MPVVFKDQEREINSKSFPFNFAARKKMLESVFGDSIKITDDYAFFAPFKKYLPPLLAKKSWKLRKQILNGVEKENFLIYWRQSRRIHAENVQTKTKNRREKITFSNISKRKLYDTLHKEKHLGKKMYLRV